MSMSRFPWADVAIAGVFNTPQAKRLQGKTSLGLNMDAILGALADAGMPLDELDGVSASGLSRQLVYDLSIGPAWTGGPHMIGIQAIWRLSVGFKRGMRETKKRIGIPWSAITFVRHPTA